MKQESQQTQSLKSHRSFVKPIAFICLVAGLISSPSGVNAQEKPDVASAPKTRPASQAFDLDIEDGMLLLAPLKRHVDIIALWGPGEVHSVTATINNLAKYLRAADPDLNIIVSPEAGAVQIKELKLRRATMASLVEGLGYATGGAIRGTQFGQGQGQGKNWRLMTSRTPQQVERTVEVFNVGGYISHIRNRTEGTQSSKDEIIHKALDDVKRIIAETLTRLQKGKPADDEAPEFQFHPGTSLFIVTGSPQAIEVTRKVVNALPGQPRPGTPELLDLPAPKSP
jgi:hypothetical protein